MGALPPRHTPLPQDIYSLMKEGVDNIQADAHFHQSKNIPGDAEGGGQSPLHTLASGRVIWHILAGSNPRGPTDEILPLLAQAPS